ncbi:MAG: glycyl radical protein [Candidatus Geothermincolia bacterium]
MAEGLASMIDTTRGTPSRRAGRLKDRLLSAPYEIDIERARSYTRIWKKAEGTPPCTKAALALKAALAEMTIRIDDDEQLVGVKTQKPLAGVIPVERGDFNTVLDFELDRLTSRDDHRFHIGEADRAELERVILPYWRGRTVRDRKADLWKQAGIYEPMQLGPAAIWHIVRGAGVKNTAKVFYLTIGRSIKSVPKLVKMQRELAALRPNLALTVFDVQGHFVPGYKRVLEMGFDGIAELASLELARLEPSDPEFSGKKDFCEAVLIAADATSALSERYATLAEEMSRTAREPRAAELEEIAARCRRVPAKPPRTFVEALQSLWMTQVALSVSYGMAGVMSTGRTDQYLGPYYEADLEVGRVTREEALEALEEYMVKLATELIMLIETGKETASEMGVGSNTITIGGRDADGKCAVNEVSWLILEAHDNVKALADNLSVRISEDTPDEFLERACRSYKYTSGVAIFNDEVITPELEADGFAPVDALDYSIVGCVEPTSTGNCFATTAGNDISLAGVLEMTLNSGRMLFAGKRIGATTPDPRGFKSFGELQEAFVSQLSFNVARLAQAVELLDKAYAESFPSPLVSATVEGCLESGKDVTRGGPLYSFGSITGRGLGTVANSLEAVRRAVFEERLLTMDELLKLLRTNFRGAENTRQVLLRKGRKYGNDDDSADELARWVTEVFCREVRKHKCARGNFYRPGMFSYGVHVIDGFYLGATPDGRLAGEPVSNGISPANGTETQGPTAVLRSAATAASPPLSNGSSLNMRLSPSLVATDEKVDKLAALVRGYFSLGGRHVQFNVVDTAVLKDAQQHPERHRDLVVRVSGYCAYFTDLGRSIQDDIIARTEFSAL